MVCSDKSVYTKFHLDWLLCEWAKGHLHPYRDVWPEAVYCYFTKTTLFAYLELEVAITSQSFVALHFPVYEIAKCIA